MPRTGAAAAAQSRLRQDPQSPPTAAGLAEEIDEPLLAAHRYEVAPSSREFELLIFPSRPLLQRGLEDLRRPDRLLDEEYEFATGANALAAFPPPTEDFRGFEIVRRVLLELK